MNNWGFINNFLENEDYDGAYTHFTGLEEAQQRTLFSYLCLQTSVSLGRMQTVVVHRRKLKPKKTFNDFFNAWLPSSCDPSASKENIEKQFIAYWRFHGKEATGKQLFGTFFHAENIQNPSEVITVGFMDKGLETLLATVEHAMNDEKQRADNISSVADQVNEPEVYRILNVI